MVIAELRQHMQADADLITAQEATRLGKYLSLSTVTVSYSESDNALAYRIDGACALAHRLFVAHFGVRLTLAQSFNESIANMSLYYSSMPQCQLIEYGAPGPPPSQPPPPSPPPPLQPPYAPPATVPVTATMRLSLNTVLEQLDPQAGRIFAAMLMDWFSQTVQEPAIRTLCMPVLFLRNLPRDEENDVL